MTILVSESEEMYNEKLIELRQQEQEFLQKIENTQREMEQEENSGSLNVGNYNALKSKLQNSQVRLAEIQQQIAELEGVGQEVQVNVESEFDNIAREGVTLRELVVDEEAYNLIAIHIKQIAVNMANEHAALVHSYKSELAAMEHTVNELSQIKGEYENLHFEYVLLTGQVEDYRTKRDAAMAELDEANSELKVVKELNERLKEDAVKLRNQLESRTVISEEDRERAAEAARIAEKIKERRMKIYDVVPNRTINPTHYKAKRAVDHEEIEIAAFLLKSYTIMEGEELARFQAELEAEKAAAKVEEPVQLAPSLPVPNAEVPTHSIPGEMAHEAETVTRAEFEALANRVAALESIRNIA